MRQREEIQTVLHAKERSRVRKQTAITALVTAAVLAGGAWWQLKKDGRPVNKVAEPQSSNKRLILPELPESKQNEGIWNRESLVPAEYKAIASSIGVPWNVERAMIGDAQSNGSPLRKSHLSEPQPDAPDSIPQPQMDSILSTPQTPPNSK
jgi:hypothetical protein